jgi:hypothetical protein
VWNGTEIRLFRNGELEGVRAVTNYAPVTTGQACGIGFNSMVPFQTGQWSFIGDLAGFRVSNVVRYITEFTPPDRPLQADGATLMLVDPSSLDTEPVAWTLPGSAEIVGTLGSTRGTAPTLEAYTP